MSPLLFFAVPKGLIGCLERAVDRDSGLVKAVGSFGLHVRGPATDYGRPRPARFDEAFRLLCHSPSPAMLAKMAIELGSGTFCVVIKLA